MIFWRFPFGDTSRLVMGSCDCTLVGSHVAKLALEKWVEVQDFRFSLEFWVKGLGFGVEGSGFTMWGPSFGFLVFSALAYRLFQSNGKTAPDKWICLHAIVV